VAAALSAMECIVVQDIFLNETAKYAHVLLPGSSFLEKDGTFTNAERRISRVRQVMPPLSGVGDWEATAMLSNALGYPMHYTHPEEIMARSPRSRPASRA
jgi:formate dehydrogenase major subunit